MAVLAAVAVPRRSSADTITIDDGAVPGTGELPFTCVIRGEIELWRPAMGFVYRDVRAFDLSIGDTIAFDVVSNLGFLPQLDIALAHASDPANPFKPDDLSGSDFTIVGHAATAASPGTGAMGRDYELAFKVDAPFHFPGGGLIIRVTNPMGELATRHDADCLPAITVDTHPSGTNHLVGTFQLDDGEYPWPTENTGTTANVPYVQIKFTRCGDGVKSGAEVCDDGNADTTDDCTNACQAPACGDGVVSVSEECDNSSTPDKPDPYCNNQCHLDAFAKGSGCSASGGIGLLAALAVAMILVPRGRRWWSR